MEIDETHGARLARAQFVICCVRALVFMDGFYDGLKFIGWEGVIHEAAYGAFEQTDSGENDVYRHYAGDDRVKNLPLWSDEQYGESRYETN